MTATQKSTLNSAIKVENNQVLGANDEHLMFFETNALTNGSMLFQNNTSFTSFNSDLSNLTDGEFMFYSTSLESFSGDLSNLTNGFCMFSIASLKSFSGDLSSLTNGNNMFYNSSLESFSGDLSSLTNGEGMFFNTKLDATSLANILHFINTPTTKGTINIGLGIDNTDDAKQSLATAVYCKDWAEVNQEFDDKNWTVQWQFNGAPTSAATLDMDTIPSPVFVKIDEVIADENGKLPHYSYVTEDGSKFFNLHWYHESNDDNQGYDYFGSLLEACGAYGIVPKEQLENA